MFEDIEPTSSISAPYEVFGFEASPLIQPFAEQFFAWLNGERAEEPLSCLPRSGSTSHLNMFAPLYGCPVYDCRPKEGARLGREEQKTRFREEKQRATEKEDMRKCMWSKLSRQLAALHPDPQLNSSSLILRRLDRARLQCGIASSSKDQFTFIPAAAGSANNSAWLNFYGPPHQLIRGGSIAYANNSDVIVSVMQGGDRNYDFSVQTVDVADWIETSFLPRDHVILKMDVEGAEHGILKQMIQRHKMALIDVLSLECHGLASDCAALLRVVKKAAPSITIVTEGVQHQGFDKHSEFNSTEAQAIVQACAAIDPGQFKLSRIGRP